MNGFADVLGRFNATSVALCARAVEASACFGEAQKRFARAGSALSVALNHHSDGHGEMAEFVASIAALRESCSQFTGAWAEYQEALARFEEEARAVCAGVKEDQSRYSRN